MTASLQPVLVLCILAFACCYLPVKGRRLAGRRDDDDQRPWRRKLTPSEHPDEVISGHFIIVFNDDLVSSDDEVDTLSALVANETGAQILWVYKQVIKGVALAGVDSQGTLDRILLRDDIERVEQDHIVKFDLEEQRDTRNLSNVISVNATHRVLLTKDLPDGLDRIDQRSLPLDGKYRYRYDGSGVTVFIIDSGTRQSHVDFQGKALVCGFDAYAKDGDQDRCVDMESHGTHIAGTVGGRASGVAKGARLVTVKVMNREGHGSDAGIISGMEYVIAQKKAQPWVPMVVNMSLGGLRTSSFNRAVNKVVDAGVVVVAAAGNMGVNACLFSPASSKKVITVGASSSSRIRKRDRRYFRSNRGRCVDLFAPGYEILSAFPADDWSYMTKSGTSMAAAHVSGAAALYLQRNPKLTPKQVHDALVRDASDGKLMMPFDFFSPNKLLYTGRVGEKKAI